MSTTKQAAPLPSIPADDFRACMRHLAGAVTVIATGAPGHRFGLTATAVCSLSDDPATLLVCVNRAASAHDVISRNRNFSVNLLADDQEPIAGRFSGRAGHKGETRFEGGDWRTLATGAPTLVNSLTTFDCEVNQEHVFATHTIFIGRVVASTTRGSAEPLVYLRGAFRHLLPA
ncbi:MAG: flavin reductase family protein [Hyphomicrobiaceae bacterium]